MSDKIEGLEPDGVRTVSRNVPGDEDVEGHRKNHSVVDDGGPEGAAKAAIPGSDEDDVEGHRARQQVVDDGGPEGLRTAKRAIPSSDEDDVEGHIYTRKRTDGEFADRKVPGDSPHGEGAINNKL